MTILHGYCNLDELKAWAGISDPNDDTNLERCIEVASRAVDRYCGRQFWKSDTPSSITRKPSGAGLVYCPDFWTVDELDISTDDDDDGAYETVWTVDEYSPETFDIDGLATGPYWQIRAIGRLFPLCNQHVRSVQITAKWGWQTVPVEVEQACLIKSLQLFQRRQSPAGVQGNDQFGFVRVSRYEDPTITDLLDVYRSGPAVFGLA